MKIPFNRAALMGRELANTQEAIAGGHISGSGPFTARCEKELETLLGARKTILTTSCTDALEMVALLLDLRPGDEILLPSFTFVSTVNAFALRGAAPIFCDIRPDTLNLDPDQVRAKWTPRTRAVIAVHYAGVACEMDPLLEIARAGGVPIVEDNAHGLLGTFRGRPLGSFGALATQSFHETKNFSCGEGGALVVNEERFVERAEILRDKGTNRSRFFRGQVDKYTWVDLGSSFGPSDMLAAFLLGQWEAREAIQAGRRAVWETYDRELAGWAAANGVRRPIVPSGCIHPAHLYYLLMPDLKARTAFIDHLKARDVLAVFHYQPLHLSEMGQRLGGRRGDCPVTERVADQLVRLPLYNAMSEAEVQQVLESVMEFRCG